MEPSEIKMAMLAGVIGSRRDARRLVTKHPTLGVEEIHQKWLAEQAETGVASGSVRRDLAFVMRTMMFSSLPIEAPETDTYIKRFRMSRGGKIGVGTITFKSLEFDAGTKLVHGPLDRKILTVLSSLAVKRRDARLIFASTADCLEACRMNKGGGYDDLKESLERWQSCSINLKVDTENDRTLAKRGILADLSLPKQSSGNKMWLELDPMFVKMLLDEPFPIPWEYLEPFSKKPMGWDLAMFMAVRGAACRTPTRIPIFSKDDSELTLMKQFSSKDSNPHRYTASLKKYLDEIKKKWSDLNAEVDGRYLVLYPSKYMVEYTGANTYLLPAFLMDGEEPQPPSLFDKGTNLPPTGTE